MNKSRRARLETAVNLLDDVFAGEQEALENMPESFQEGEKDESMQEGLDNIAEAKELIDEVLSKI